MDRCDTYGDFIIFEICEVNFLNVLIIQVWVCVLKGELMFLPTQIATDAYMKLSCSFATKWLHSCLATRTSWSLSRGARDSNNRFKRGARLRKYTTFSKAAIIKRECSATGVCPVRTWLPVRSEPASQKKSPLSRLGCSSVHSVVAPSPISPRPHSHRALSPTTPHPMAGCATPHSPRADDAG
jgi:hypothetical protein